MAKKKIRSTEKSFTFPKALQGALLLSLGVLMLLSLISFVPKQPTQNWLGLVGHYGAFTFQYLLGLASLFVPLYLGWVGVVFLRGGEFPRLKHLYFTLFVISSAVILAMLGHAYLHFAAFFHNWVVSEAVTPLFDRHYLGGVPLHHLYVDMTTFNLSHVLGTVGTGLIFSTIASASLWLLFDAPKIPARELGLKLWSKVKAFEFKRAPQIAAEPIPKPRFERDPEPLPEMSVPHPATRQVRPKQKIEAPQKIAPPKTGKYQLPPSTLLTHVEKGDTAALKSDLRQQAEVLEETLMSFGIEAKVGEIHCGPTITSFEVHPAIGVKVQKIKTLENDIALNMQARSIRIIAPIPGKAAVGIEVPNPQPQEVGFRGLLENYHKGKKHGHIPLLLGQTVNGEDVWTDLTKMPHLIIAGATGSGKSVCINTIVMSIVMNAAPEDIKLVMVDPKKVELTSYSQLPHMLAPVITEATEAYAALSWLVKEMERRYDLFRQLGIRNIHGFNERKPDIELEASLESSVPDRLPYIVVIIDELADLMMVSSSDIETPIARLAQMARAVGIHVILATQRPSREVITGLIKANFPTRISFKVSSRVNSQIVLDENGAECLLGNGDMLFMPPGTSHLTRAQGAFIRDEDIHRVIDYICAQAPTEYMIPSFQKYSEEILTAESAEPKDAMYDQAKALVFETGTASTTFLQRKLKVGYARAAGLMDELEANGVIGPQEGAKPRRIFYPGQED